MKKDIQNRTDLELLVTTFYIHVVADKSMGHYFTEVRQFRWEEHLVTMVDFWENVLFHQNDYEGNPMSIHKTINEKHKIKKNDFARWIKLFNKTVNELYAGENAEKIKLRANRIAQIMKDSLFRNKKA